MPDAVWGDIGDDVANAFLSLATPALTHADLSSPKLSTKELCELVEDLGFEVEEFDGFTVNGERVTRDDAGEVVTLGPRAAGRRGADG